MVLVRRVTLDDQPAWLDLVHESDELIGRLLPDITAFYAGFDDYMARKIRQHEAFMAVDRVSSQCLGIIAFSKNHNRITFLGVTGNTDLIVIGSKLMETALNKLDSTREISVNVLKVDSIIMKQERDLYELFGFIVTDDEVCEGGILAYVMKRPAMLPDSKEVRT